MKKLLLFLSFLFPASLAFAQDTSMPEDGSGFEIGLKTGINNTWIIIDNELTNNEHHDEHFTVKPAPIGLTAGFKFNSQTSIMLEGFWSKQGGNFDILDDNGKTVGEKQIKLDYLVVPLLFKFTGEGETRFAMALGGQMAFLMKGNETNTFDQDVTYTKTYNGSAKTIQKGEYLLATTDADKEKPEMYKFNKKDINIVADLGVEHDFSPKCYLSAGLRLVYGFKDISTSETVVSLYNPDKYTLRYNVTGGIHVGLHWFL